MSEITDMMVQIWAWIISDWASGVWPNLFQGSLILADAGETVFNASISMCSGFILKTPSGSYPEAWNLMKGFAQSSAAIGIANDLVIVGFLVSLIEYSITVRSHIELEDLIKMFARMCLANYLVFHYMDLIEGIWKVTAMLVNTIMPDTDVSLLGESTVVLPSFSLVWLILAVVYAVIMIVLGFRIISAFFERFLWAFLALPFGAPAFATMVGTGQMNQSVKAYIRYIIATALEFVAFALLIRLLGSISAGFRGTLYSWIIKSGAGSNVILILAVSYLGNICFASMTAGLIAKIDSQVSKMLAL